MYSLLNFALVSMTFAGVMITWLSLSNLKLQEENDRLKIENAGLESPF